MFFIHFTQQKQFSIIQFFICKREKFYIYWNKKWTVQECDLKLHGYQFTALRHEGNNFLKENNLYFKLEKNTNILFDYQTLPFLSKSGIKIVRKTNRVYKTKAKHLPKSKVK